MTRPEADRRRRQSEYGRDAEQDRRDHRLYDEPRFGVGHNRGPPLDDGDRVLSFRQWCELNGFSPATGRRLIAAGTGPIITQLSPRRIGITIRNNRAWHQMRSRNNP
jgi:hypothetical protein